MSNVIYKKANVYSPFFAVGEHILSFDFIWPLPLIVMGVTGWLDPLLISLAIGLALLPFITHLLLLGKLTYAPYVASSLLLLVIGGLVSMWASYDPHLSWPLFLTLLGSVCLYSALANSLSHPAWVARGLVVLGAIAALYFVGQYAHFDYQGETGRLARVGLLSGSMWPDLAFFIPQTNAVAGFLEGVVLLSLVLTWRAQGSERIAWGLSTALITYSLLITQSRGSWLGLMVALAIGLILLMPKRRLRLIVASGLLAGVGLVSFVVVSRLMAGEQVPFVSAAAKTATSRLILYRNSLNLWSDYILTGMGMGDVFAMIYSRYQLLIPVPYLTYTHNLFLTVALGLGVLGLIALIWLLVSYYAFVIRVELSDHLSRRSRSIFRAAWLGITVIFLHGLTDAPQFSAPGWTMPMFFALLGLTVLAGRPAVLQARETQSVGRIELIWVISVVFFIGLIAAGGLLWRPLLSVWHANLGVVYQTRSDLSPRLDDFEREVASDRAISYFADAMDLDPTRAVANRRFGLMALDKQVFDVAVIYLERAYRQEPFNQATLKGLGLAYLWTGQLDPAENLLGQLDDQGEIIEELGGWQWWWGTQDREDLAQNAVDMRQRLAREN